MNTNLSVKVGTLEFSKPVIPASGVWPYEPDFWCGEKLDGIGALCTKAISRNPKSGNKGIRVWETTAGVLNSIGLQNLGVDGFIDKYKDLISSCPVPVIANVVMEKEDDTCYTLSKLSQMGCISAAELNISCPNVDGEGMAWGIDPKNAAKAVRIARKAWDGPLWVKMTPQTSDPAGVAAAIESEGADCIVAANTWLGMAMDMTCCKPVFNRVTAGFSGPAIFPMALRLVWQVSSSVNIPVVGCGGIMSSSDCAAMMLAGASAVQVGTAFFKNIKAGAHICAGLPDFMKQSGVSCLSDMVGKAKK